jgi:hypothetical protein
MECSHTGLRDVVDDVALLLLEGGGDGEDAFDEATGCGAVGAPAPFAPENRGPQRAFGGVVRGLNAGHVAAIALLLVGQARLTSGWPTYMS